MDDEQEKRGLTRIGPTRIDEDVELEQLREQLREQDRRLAEAVERLRLENPPGYERYMREGRLAHLRQQTEQAEREAVWDERRATNPYKRADLREAWEQGRRMGRRHWKQRRQAQDALTGTVADAFARGYNGRG